ncbi:TetR/AcrR family transcriptional regulator [Allostreptomyces psammosilenae]|uniref:AcrR family transcriptional regulator n=1 Tax=Allostreptomyces psammosilenae TaxID=1892865 RepID=A0A853A945_9ACTN|nr:TetR/AcrR family transcriptional regulator [Allostreptomyces psammosilenae]NYI06942.1 AcrR family transcriptional regulator [Allostreptomyces psammosilenae]
MGRDGEVITAERPAGGAGWAAVAGRREDPRVRRTRDLLRRAALELAAERDPDGITVADIAERATVNRATVYQHYADRDALLLDAMGETIADLSRACARCPLTSPSERVPAELVELFRHVERHAALYGRVLGPRGSARAAGRLREVLAEEILAQLTAAAPAPAVPGSADPAPPAVPTPAAPDRAAGRAGGVAAAPARAEGVPPAQRAHYLAGALAGLFAHWLGEGAERNGKPAPRMPAETMARHAWSLLGGAAAR